MTHPDERRARTRRAVSNLVTGTPLQVQELPGELVITNPDDPGRGKVHVEYPDGYACLERLTWTYWGTLEGLRDTGEGLVATQTILDTLLGRTSAS